MSDPADDLSVPPVGRLRPKKAPNAFRTISEVADDLHIPQHVLRFWETKFPQVKPLKRGGGRRYYRPDDIALLRRVFALLSITPPQPPAERPEAGADREAGPPPEPELPMPGLAPVPPQTARVTVRQK